jgi:serine/threonine protein phosphatase 1
MSSQKIFAIGDIHGCADELQQLLQQLPLHEDPLLIFLGDYVDRGPNSKEVIETLIDLKSKHNVITLMGNHESMFLSFLEDPSSILAGFFILNGGSATLASYVTQGNHYEIPDEHLQFLRSLDLTYSTDTHFFVHAGVPDIPLKDVDHQKHLNDLLWIRKAFIQSDYPWEKVVVHGHTPTAIVDQTRTRINLDTGCVFNGSLTAMEMNSGEIIQIKAQNIPTTYLKEDPRISRVAKRFMGSIPVFVETENGYDEFLTVNYNEFGLLIVDTSGGERVFEVGQILQGKIGDLSREQIPFAGQVVRHQRKDKSIAYGIQMIEMKTPGILK